MSSAVFVSPSSLLSFRGDFCLLYCIGTNDAKLAADDTEVVGAIIAQRISPAAGDRGGAGGATGAGGLLQSTDQFSEPDVTRVEHICILCLTL